MFHNRNKIFMKEKILEKSIKNSGFKSSKNDEQFFFMCKISTIFQEEEIVGSGFFIKLSKNNKPLNCLMTNEHIIKKEMINSNEIQMISLLYDNYRKKRSIILNKNERFIQEFTFMNIDVTIIEILQKDNINNNKFLNSTMVKGDYNKYKDKKILIPQFPNGAQLCYSIGRINEIYQNDYLFSHSSSTSFGSSGSPIILLNDLNKNFILIGIHSASSKVKEENYGYFIKPILQYLNRYIFGDYYYEGEVLKGLPNGSGKLYNKNNILIFSGRFKDGEKIGYGTEYFDNKKVKYKGYFHNNVYDGLGLLYYFERSYYKGLFKNGFRHGEGAVYDEKNNLVHKGFFENGDFIGASPIRIGNYGFDNDNMCNKTMFMADILQLKIASVKPLRRNNSNVNYYMKTI